MDNGYKVTASLLGAALGGYLLLMDQVDKDIYVGEALSDEGMPVRLVHACGTGDCDLEEFDQADFLRTYDSDLTTVEEYIATHQERQEQLSQYAKEIVGTIDEPQITALYNKTVQEQGDIAAAQAVGSGIEHGFSKDRLDELGLTATWTEMRSLAVEARMEGYRLADLKSELEEKGVDIPAMNNIPGMKP